MTETLRGVSPQNAVEEQSDKLVCPGAIPTPYNPGHTTFLGRHGQPDRAADIHPAMWRELDRCPQESALDRARGDTGLLGDLVDGHTGQVVQAHSPPMPGGEPAQRLLDVEPLFGRGGSYQVGTSTESGKTPRPSRARGQRSSL